MLAKFLSVVHFWVLIRIHKGWLVARKERLLANLIYAKHNRKLDWKYRDRCPGKGAIESWLNQVNAINLYRFTML
jgi:hypothetical protein